jgi:hypothetical protein
MIKSFEFGKYKGLGFVVKINNRWDIFLDDGCVYDTLKAEDIPQWVFLLRDLLIGISCRKAIKGAL